MKSLSLIGFAALLSLHSWANAQSPEQLAPEQLAPEQLAPEQLAPEQQDSQPNRLSPLMQLKLERSKAILEGLALEDFDKISASAQALRLLSLESGWNVIQTEEYGKQSQDFRRTSALIAEAARDKDLGRATLGYVALTVRCVECHGYMRKHHSEANPSTEPLSQ